VTDTSRAAFLLPVVVTLLVIISGTGITLLTGHRQTQFANEQNWRALEREADRVESAVVDRFGAYAGVLEGAAAFYRSSSRVTPEEWMTWVTSLPTSERYGGLRNVAYIGYHTRDELDAFLAHRRVTDPGFTVTPPGEREDYRVIELMGPTPGSAGIDIGLDPGRRETFDRARDTGAPAMTPLLILTRDLDLPPAQRQPAVTVYVPVYEAGADTSTVAARRQALEGWTAAGFRIADLLPHLGIDTNRISMEFFVGHPTDAAPLGQVGTTSTAAPELMVVRSLDLFGRTISLRIRPQPAMLTSEADARTSAWIVGGALTGALATALWVMLGQRRRLSRAALNAVAELRRTESRYTAIFAGTATGIAVLNERDRLSDVNGQLARLVDSTRDELLGTSFLDLVDPEDHPALIEALRAARSARWSDPHAPAPAPSRPAPVLLRLGQRGRDPIRCQVRVSFPACPEGGHDLFVEVTDVSVEWALEQRLAEEREFLRVVLDSVDAGIVACDDDGEVTMFNLVARQLHALDLVDAHGGDHNDAVFVSLRREDGTAITSAAHPLCIALGGEPSRGTEALIEPPGCEPTHVLINAQPISDRQGGIAGAVAVYHDITERKRNEHEQLRQLALHDQLTGLPNRRLLQDRLRAAIERARRHGTGVAVLFVDMDRFKAINDTMGHATGDLVLKGVAERIEASLRGMDTGARLGGDEFVVICEGVESEADASRIAQRLDRSISRPLLVDDGQTEVDVSVSIGVALWHPDDDESDLLRKADAAMYAAKRAGRARSHLYQKGMLREASERVSLTRDLRRALSTPGELRLEYQPVVDLDTLTVTGAEALLRWQHPEHGLLLPGRFLPVVEDTDLMGPLGRWVLAEAGRAEAIRAALATAGDAPFCMSVNVSARQLSQSTFSAEVLAIAARCGIDPARLCLEITETSLVDAPRSARRELQALKERGVRIALDDYGTGYASVSYLRRFPIDIVKIDRSLVAGIAARAEDEAIVTAVLRLADSLNLVSVAEGIETLDQYEALTRLGCALGQGYLFARPRPLDSLHRPLDLLAGAGPAIELVDG
jgi:diguanylate cyclase (GGDEF)-like protein/PAS domain S-box-containing protein